MISIKEKYNNILSNHIVSFKQISYDSSKNEYLVNSEVNAVNFDNVVAEYSEINMIKNNRMKSLDALFQNDDELVFIEFKNTAKNVKEDVKYKIYGSIYVLLDISGLTTDYIREHVKFILVYKQKSLLKEISQQKIEDSMLNYSKIERNNIIRFNMGEYKGTLFKEVYTYTSDEFKTHFIDNL